MPVVWVNNQPEVLKDEHDVRDALTQHINVEFADAAFSILVKEDCDNYESQLQHKQVAFEIMQTDLVILQQELLKKDIDRKKVNKLAARLLKIVESQV